MILSKEFYDDCDPQYKEVIDKLESDLDDIENSDDTIAIKSQNVLSAIASFSKSYLVPKEYWQHCLRNIRRNNKRAPDFDTYKKLCCDFVKLAYFHLCCVKKWNTFNFRGYYYSAAFEPYADNYLKLDNFHWGPIIDEDTVITERDLSYPHDMLEECFRAFEKQTTKVPSKKLIQRYEEMLKLYPAIEDEDDYEKWYQLLLQVGDNDYVRNNIEYCLGEDLLDDNLWKIYIGFLKEYGEYKHLLGVYSKYCRFFLDDSEMKKEYEEAMIKYGPINLPWENLFDFEARNGLEEEEETQDSDSEVKEKSPFDKKICADFYKTRKRQNFSLPGPLVLYILQNAGHRVLQKLFFSCKYFFAKQPTPICYSLQTVPPECYKDESLTLEENPKQESFPKNLYVTGNLFAGTDSIPGIAFLPKFYRCEAKYICLGELDFSFDELKFLIGHGGVIELFLYCKIKDENGHFIDLEKIMALLPNVEVLCLENVKTNAKTGHVLAEQKLQSKIFEFSVNKIFGVPFDIFEFLKFITANKDKKRFSGRFYFNKDFDAAFVVKIKQIMVDYRSSHQKVSTTADFERNFAIAIAH